MLREIESHHFGSPAADVVDVSVLREFSGSSRCRVARAGNPFAARVDENTFGPLRVRRRFAG
jgi:hypothetical protein